MPLGARTSLIRRGRARRLSNRARVLIGHAPVADEGQAGPRTTVVGLDPVRVLLFGSGPLTGYGVEHRRDAVDGHLAEALAERSGRGVVVENRVKVDLDTTLAERSLGGAGTATFDVAVWSPRFTEELLRLAGRRSAFRGLLRDLRAHSTVPLVVCLLPVPAVGGWRFVLRRPRIAAFNRMVSAEAAAAPGVTVVALSPYRPEALGPAYHRQMAAELLPAVAAAAGLPDPPLQRVAARG